MAFAIPLIGALAAAGSTGVAIDELVNQPSAPKPTPGVTPNQSNAIKGAISTQAPDIVEQTGGAVSPAYTLALSQLQGGTAGTPGSAGSAQQIINQLFGLGGGTGGAPSPSPTTSPGAGVQSFQPAGLSGGNGAGIADEGLSNLLQQVTG